MRFRVVCPRHVMTRNKHIQLHQILDNFLTLYKLYTHARSCAQIAYVSRYLLSCRFVVSIRGRPVYVCYILLP